MGHALLYVIYRNWRWQLLTFKKLKNYRSICIISCHFSVSSAYFASFFGLFQIESCPTGVYATGCRIYHDKHFQSSKTWWYSKFDDEIVIEINIHSWQKWYLVILFSVWNVRKIDCDRQIWVWIHAIMFTWCKIWWKFYINPHF